jgi:hypothetical protein
MVGTIAMDTITMDIEGLDMDITITMVIDIIMEDVTVQSMDNMDIIEIEGITNVHITIDRM